MHMAAMTTEYAGVDAPTGRTKICQRENLLGDACVSVAIMLCIFGIWCTYSPLTVPNRYTTVTHIRHLAQSGSGTTPVPLPLSNVTRLGLQDKDTVLVLFPRAWQTACWSRVVFRFHRYPYDKVTGIEVLAKATPVRALAWIGDRLIIDTAFNETFRRFEHLGFRCRGSRTTLGIAFLRLDDGRWDEAVIVRASGLVRSFPLVKIEDGLWLAGMPSGEDQWQGRVRHIADIPGNVSLFGPSTQSSIESYV